LRPQAHAWLRTWILAATAPSLYFGAGVPQRHSLGDDASFFLSDRPKGANTRGVSSRLRRRGRVSSISRFCRAMHIMYIQCGIAIVYCLSVCLSVTLVICGHKGLVTSKAITWIISFGISLLEATASTT